MRRLVDGALALFREPPAESEVRRIDDPARFLVAPSERPALMRLAHGLDDGEGDDDDALSSLLAALQRAGLAGDGLPEVDAVVDARLEALGRGFSWRLTGGGDDEARALVAFVRRMHGRRKGSFLAYWQGPCLPEHAAARALVARRALPEGARIFLVGDDDLLSLALARAGFRVTAIDIDETLIALIERLAREEGLAVDARVHDLTQPLPGDVIGRFDAAMTDPQSGPGTMLGFLARALAAVPPGAPVWVSVHDRFRCGFSDVMRRLPARALDVKQAFSAYYTHGYFPDPYRSDFVTLERTSGALPYGPGDEIPREVFLAEHTPGAHHALCAEKVLAFGAAPFVDVDALPGALRARFGDERFRALTSGHAGSDAWLYGAQAGGGHLALRFDFKRRRLAYAFTPVAEGDEAGLVDVVTGRARVVRQAELCGLAPLVGAAPYRV